jgi:tetratricopeptide (TPR) repeat protein
MQGCSTKKNKWINRTFHNITSKYNGYFNGEEALKEGVAMLETSHVDNYFKVLPVYEFGTIENSKAIIPLTDKAVKKASVVISRHSMLIRGKEYCKYIDDCYLLIGKSMFYKRDYYASLEMFAYVAREPVKNFKKDPIQHKANIWLCRAYSELGMFDDAQAALDRSINDKTTPNNIKGELYLAITDFYLKQNKYPEALEAVNECLKYIKKKKKRARILFIQGQLYQKKNELKLASKAYASVLKCSPTYEMSFYSRINMARCFDSENKNSSEIRLLLAKMLKDPKNVDFKDQIYYVLGELEEKEGKEKKAIEQYSTSVQVSTTNQNQKGMSYLAIAEIYFDQRAYRNSAAYYDSTVNALSKEYPDYKKIEEKRNSLAELVRKYLKIELYDSLLQMAKLSPEDLDKKAIEIFKKEEEARRKQQEKEARQAALSSSGSSTGAPGTTGNGSWYFYNTTTMSFGFTEFRKIWGDRKLEDNWRRSNKEAVIPIAENPDADTSATVSQKTGKKATREDSIAVIRKKLQDALPKNDTMRLAYADSVMEAFYDLGLIYKERLADLQKAAETFEEFLSKYPNNSNEATLFYQLYRIFLAIPDAPKAEDYKKRILAKYPDSEYAKIITDPEFFKNENLSKSEASKFYEETYLLYQAKQYTDVISRCRTSETRYQGNALSPKFALLKALAIGQTRDIDAFKTSLQSVVKNFPTDSVKVKATELLNSLNKVQGITPKDSVVAPMFSYKADTLHYYVVIVESISFDLADFKTHLSDFNTMYFSLNNLQINNRLLGANYQVVVIQSFPNRLGAFDYMRLIDDDDTVFLNMDMNITDAFIISVENYNTLMKNGKVSEYLDFYKRVYQ